MSSKYQLKLLKKVNNLQTVNFENATDSEKSVYQYLASESYLDIEYEVRCESSQDSVITYNVPIKVHITEKRTACLSERTSEYKRYIIPLVLNTLISIEHLSILKTLSACHYFFYSISISPFRLLCNKERYRFLNKYLLLYIIA